MTQPQVRLNVTGIGEVVRRLDPPRYLKSLRIAFNRVGELFKKTLMDETPRKTGTLANSWVFKVQRAGKGFFLRLTNPIPYGPWVNFGTGTFIGKGLIRPTTASVMVFRVGARLVFARSTRGQPGQHFTERGADIAAPQIPSVVQKALQRTLDGKRP